MPWGLYIKKILRETERIIPARRTTLLFLTHDTIVLIDDEEQMTQYYVYMNKFFLHVDSVLWKIIYEFLYTILILFIY